MKGILIQYKSSVVLAILADRELSCAALAKICNLLSIALQCDQLQEMQRRQRQQMQLQRVVIKTQLKPQ